MTATSSATGEKPPPQAAVDQAAAASGVAFQRLGRPTTNRGALHSRGAANIALALGGNVIRAPAAGDPLCRAFGHLHMWLKNLRINYVIPLVSSRTWLTIEFVLAMEGDFDEA